jgi:predicted RNase H-like HicB family nuclease
MIQRKTFEQADLLTSGTNFAVVQLRGRNFPGVVVQGDSLSVLVAELRGILTLLEADDKAEAIDVTQQLFEHYSDVLQTYEFTCKKHGIELPYNQTGQ